MATITYTDEASEAFVTEMVEKSGYVVRITTTDGQEFDAQIVGTGVADIDDNFSVRVRRVDGDWNATGEEFSVVARDVRIY